MLTILQKKLLVSTNIINSTQRNKFKVRNGQGLINIVSFYLNIQYEKEK